MARFRVRPTDPRRFDPRHSAWLVVDGEDGDREVARFPSREDAEAHADRINEGPLDLDEQASWQDPDEDDDWGTWKRWD